MYKVKVVYIKMKREFDGKKLYNLLKNIVVVITLLALFIAVTNYNDINSNEYAQDVHKCDQKYPNIRSDQAESLLWSTCLMVANGILKLQQDNFSRAGIVAILLPLIFFGGTWFFKYIFPIKDET